MTERRDELGAVRHAVLAGRRLVTLTGPGGIGKTWLARRAAAEVGRQFTDGSRVLELGERANDVSLARQLGDAMELPLGSRHPTEAGEVRVLAQLVADQHLLLVLDRCEPVLARAAAVVAELLRECPRLHVLTTSRQPLGITGERVLPVPPLAVPEEAVVRDPLAALAHGAVALYVERAAAALPEFRLTEENVGAVCEVCRRLDGNPLAIELAAARSGLLAPEAVLERLDDRYRLLVSGAPQRSLRASVDASWELCTEPERQLWARMSVLPASVELDAVEDVCSGDGIDEADVLDLVDSLLAKSVLSRESDPSSVRYRLPETLRAYGAERLGPDETRSWSVRHERWVERLVMRAAGEWFGPRQTSHLRRLGREHPHLAQVLDTTTATPEQAPRALETLLALERWWVVVGRVSQARTWLAAALRHGTGTQRQRAGGLGVAAWFAAYEGDLDVARELLEEATRVGDDSPATLRTLARARGGLALAAGDDTRADASFEEVVGLGVRAGDDAAAAEGWLLLGFARALAGRAHDAERSLRRCLALCERAGESQLRASAVALEAFVARNEGRHASARSLAREALRTKAAVGDWVAVAFLIEILATVTEDPARGGVLLGAADRAWRRVGLNPAFLEPTAVARETWSASARETLGRREFDRQVARGAAMAWERVLGLAEDDVLPRQRRPVADVPLTSRELAVAELVARGMTNREIAGALVISVRTVQGHLEHILRKLGFGSRAQVAAWVAQRDAESAGS